MSHAKSFCQKKMHRHFSSKPSIFSTGAFINRNISLNTQTNHKTKHHAEKQQHPICVERFILLYHFNFLAKNQLRISTRIFHLFIVLFSCIFYNFSGRTLRKKKIVYVYSYHTEILEWIFNLFIAKIKKRSDEYFPWRPRVNISCRHNHENLNIRVFFLFVASRWSICIF